jgi:S1-C subfamily serine protease
MGGWRDFRLLAFLLVLGCSPQEEPAELPAQGSFDLAVASASTLRVVAFDGRRGSGGYAAGSGVLIAPNIVLTNLHVVAPARESSSGAIYIWDNGADYPTLATTIIDVDPRLDLALVFVRGLTSTPITIALSNPTQLEQVTALGFPAVTDRLLDRITATVSATSGQVTTVDEGALSDYGAAELIVHTATVNPGNSGGPLFNSCGELVGINTLRANPDEASNTFVASSSSEIVGFARSFGIEVRTAPDICRFGAELEECPVSRADIDRAIEGRDIAALNVSLRALPSGCFQLRREAAAVHRALASDAVNAFVRMSGTWRLDTQECEDRVHIILSGLAVWGAADGRMEVERITAVSSDSAVTTATIYPSSSNGAIFRYALRDGRLLIENTTTNTSWEMIRCTG